MPSRCKQRCLIVAPSAAYHTLACRRNLLHIYRLAPHSDVFIYIRVHIVAPRNEYSKVYIYL